MPVTALHRLAAVAPARQAFGVNHLAFDVEAGDEKAVAGILQILKNRARILPHEYRVRGIVVNSKLVSDAVSFADPMKRNPGSWRVGQVVVPAIRTVHPGIGHCSTR